MSYFSTLGCFRFLLWDPFSIGTEIFWAGIAPESLFCYRGSVAQNSKRRGGGCRYCHTKIAGFFRWHMKSQNKSVWKWEWEFRVKDHEWIIGFPLAPRWASFVFSKRKCRVVTHVKPRVWDGDTHLEMWEFLFVLLADLPDCMLCLSLGGLWWLSDLGLEGTKRHLWGQRAAETTPGATGRCWTQTLTWSFCYRASLWWPDWCPSLCRVCLWLAAPCHSCPSRGCLPQAGLSPDAPPRGVPLRWRALLHPPDAPCPCARSSPSAPFWAEEASGTAEPPAGRPAGSWSWVSCGGDPRHKHGLLLLRSCDSAKLLLLTERWQNLEAREGKRAAAPAPGGAALLQPFFWWSSSVWRANLISSQL